MDEHTSALTPTRFSSTGLTVEDRKNLRKAQYKKGGPPNWRETYRERCANHLKKKRQSLFDQNRGPSSSPSQQILTESVHSVMQEEWDQLRSEMHLPKVTIIGKRHAVSPVTDAIPPKQSQVDCGLFTPPRQMISHYVDSDQSDPNEDIEYILTLMDEITVELIEEERSVILQYEDNMRFCETALSSAIHSLTQDDNTVVCPLCLKNVLIQENQIIYCTCGLRIDTEQDGVTLEYVSRQLTEGTKLHSQICSAVPSFRTDGILDLQNLIMTCSACGFMYIIL